MKKSILISIIIVLLTSPCFAVTHYVSPSGSATWANSTTIATPCSLSTANANAKAGDIVYLRAGTYNTQIAPANSGSAGAVITYSRIVTEDKPHITLTSSAVTGANLANRSYIKLDGIVFTVIFNAYGALLAPR